MIAFLKSTTPLGALTYDAGLSTTVQRIVDPLVNMPPTVRYGRSTGRSLRGRGYQHELWKWRVYSVVIGADALNEDTTLRAFLAEWLSAPYRYISPDASSDYVLVNHDADEFTAEYIESIILLPQITLALSEVEAS